MPKKLTRIKLSCQVCGKEHFKPPCHVKRIKHFIVCSIECKRKAMIGFKPESAVGKVARKCKECGNEFHVWPHVLKNGYGHFCSSKCRKTRAGDKLRNRRRRENVILHHETYCEMIIKSKGSEVKVLFDKCDYDIVNSRTWTMSSNGYPMSGSRLERTTLHRFLMKTPKDMDTDHKDGDKLNNRRSNLRVCTTAQNTYNSRKKGRGLYKGVHKTRNGTYYAKIKKRHLGTFSTPERAALAYNRKAKELFGEFAWLNKI
jgi:hypothetical protein